MHCPEQGSKAKEDQRMQVKLAGLIVLLCLAPFNVFAEQRIRCYEQAFLKTG